MQSQLVKTHKHFEILSLFFTATYSLYEAVLVVDEEQ